MVTLNCGTLRNGSTGNSTDGGGGTEQGIPYPFVFWIFLLFEVILIVLANGMLCWLFSTKRKLRSQQNYFIASLSFSDLLVGLTVTPCEYCAIRQLTHGNDYICKIGCGTITSFNMLASTMNLILIAADRFYAIKRPFRYNETLTKSRIRIIISIGWIVVFMLVLAPLSWTINPNESVKKTIDSIYMEFLFTLILLIGVGLGICYYTIVRLVKSKLKDSGEKSSNPAGIKVCVMVAISFFCSWIPTCIVENLLFFKYNVSPAIMNANYFILLMNPLLDPIMYAYYRKDFRHEVRNWVKRQWNSIKSITNVFCKERNNNKNIYKRYESTNQGSKLTYVNPSRASSFNTSEL